MLVASLSNSSKAIPLNLRKWPPSIMLIADCWSFWPHSRDGEYFFSLLWHSWRYKKDTDYTYCTHRVSQWRTRDLVVNPSDAMKERGRERNHLSALPLWNSMSEETKLFLEIIAATIYPLGTKWEVLRMDLFLRKSLCNTEMFVCICITPSLERPGRVLYSFQLFF